MHAAWDCTYSLAKKLIDETKALTTNRSDDKSQILSSIRNIYNNLQYYQQQYQNYMNEIDDLLKFSLTHCDNEYTEEILDAIVLLESYKSTADDQNRDDDCKQDIETHVRLPDQVDFNYTLQSNQDLEQLNKILRSNPTKYLNQLFRLDVKLSIVVLLELDENELDELASRYEFDSCTAFQFFLYILSLNILNDDTRFKCKSLKKMLLYYVEPKSLIDFVHNEGMTDNRFGKLFKRLYHAYVEFKQIEDLNKLNIGVDVKRFRVDSDYRKLTISGMVIMDDDKFQFACTLAKFYELDLFDLYTSYIENIFVQTPDVNMDVHSTGARFEPLLSVLNEREDRFHKYLTDCLYTQIAGTELNKLICFYGLFKSADSHTSIANQHVKLINKLRHLISNLNYKELIDRPHETIQKLIDESNVQLFAKVSHSLAAIDKTVDLNPSKIHKILYLKSFWLFIDMALNTDQTVDDDEQRRTQRICEQYELVKDNMKKVSYTDFLDLVSELILSETSIDKLGLHARRELCRRLNKFIKRNYQASDGLDDDDVRKRFADMQAHLKLVESIGKIDFNFDRSLRNQLDLYLYRSDHVKIEQVLSAILVDTYDMASLNEIVRLINLNGINAKSLIKTTLRHLCLEIKLNKKEKNLMKLKVLLESLAHYIQTANASSKLKQDDIVDCMRDFCNDGDIQLDVRLNILEELKNTFANMNANDLMLLIVYKTNAIFDTCKCFGAAVEHIRSADIDTVEKRRGLFEQLLDVCQTGPDCMALYNLLKIWPAFSQAETSSNFWNSVVVQFIRLHVSFVDVLFDLKKMEQLGETDADWIKSEIFDKYDGKKGRPYQIACLKLYLVFKNPKVIESYLIEIDFDRYLTERPSDLMNDTELVCLLDDNKFYLNLIGTSLFNLFFKHIQQHGTTENQMEIAKCLNDKGHFCEAAELLSHAQKTQQTYRTLTFSLGLLKKFF